VQEWCSKTQVVSIYAHKFFNHGIDGLLLFELDAKDLHTIGVNKKHQQRVLDIIAIMTNENGMNGQQNQNNDAIIYTMGQLLLELGQMFKVGKVQDLTSRLKQQLNELQQNSNHPQMIKRGSLDLEQRNDGNKENEDQMTKIKMQDHVATSPTGVDAAWIKTQNQAKGHKRRSSLPFINTNVLDGDDDDDDISDLD